MVGHGEVLIAAGIGRQVLLIDHHVVMVFAVSFVVAAVVEVVVTLVVVATAGNDVKVVVLHTFPFVSAVDVAAVVAAVGVSFVVVLSFDPHS